MLLPLAWLQWGANTIAELELSTAEHQRANKTDVNPFQSCNSPTEQRNRNTKMKSRAFLAWLISPPRYWRLNPVPQEKLRPPCITSTHDGFWLRITLAGYFLLRRDFLKPMKPCVRGYLVPVCCCIRDVYIYIYACLEACDLQSFCP